MKKLLLFGVAALLGLLTVNAQSSIREAVAQKPHNFDDLVGVKAVMQQQDKARLKDCRVKTERIKLQNLEGFKALTVEKGSFATRSASDLLSGQFIASGASEFSGQMNWVFMIEKDANDAAKYWITNLVPEATTEKVYASLNGTTLSIPIGQLIINTSAAKAILCGLNTDGKIATTGNITAIINEAKHTITFNQGFGSLITNYPSDPSAVNSFFELISVGTTSVAENYFTPLTSYLEPVGALNYGFSKDYYSLANSISIASPFVKWEWKNTSISLKGTSWLWNYSDIEENTITSQDTNLSFDAVLGTYSVPSLTGTYKEQDSTYIWGASYDNYGVDRYIQAGGFSYSVNNRTYNLTNANLDYSIVPWNFGPGVYPFGTGVNANGWATDALISLYDKPQSTLIFDGVDIFLGKFSAPASTEFKLYVVKADLDKDGKLILGDVIASGTATPKNLFTAGENYHCLQFETLVGLDEDGFETEIPYAEINDQFALVFTGYNVPNVDLCVFSEYIDRPNGINRSYFTYTDPKTKKSVLSSWAAITNTMYMQLRNAAYSYIAPNKNEIVADVNGNTYDLTLSPLFNELALVEETCPDWINIIQTDHFVSENWGSNLQIKVKALPQGVSGRSADIKYTSFGASATISVKQGVVTGIGSVQKSIVKVIATNDSFDIIYPEGISNVTMYNVSGQILATYELPMEGKYTIPAAKLAKGAYLLKFNNNETVKIVK